MSSTANLILVVLAVGAAVAYLLWRKLRNARKISRDWATGHVDVCDSCPVIEIRKAQQRIHQLQK